MIKRTIFILIGVLFWCSSLHQALAQEDSLETLTKHAATLFLEVARIAKLSPGAQKQELSHLYKGILPRVYDRDYIMYRLLDLEETEARWLAERPEVAAEEIKRKGDWLVPQEATRDLCLKLLKAHAASLEPLLMASLTSRDVQERALAINLIYEACCWEIAEHYEQWRKSGDVIQPRREFLSKSPLQVYAPLLMHIYLTDSDTTITSRIRSTISALESPSLRDALVDCVAKGQIRPDLPEILQRLCEQYPPPPKLLQALKSRDSTIRLIAATALSRCGRPLLVPYVKQLAGDTEPDIRVMAAQMGTSLPPKDWETVRPCLLSLLSDDSGSVRGQVSLLLVLKEGKKIAHALLRLIQDETLPMEAHCHVYQAMCHLAGQDFGYVNGYYGKEDWHPTTPENRTAIGKFADWIQANVSEADETVNR